MWTNDDITIEIEEAEHPSVIVVIQTPAGCIMLAGELERRGGELHITAAHIQGLKAGAMKRAGLNALARKFIEEADVEALVIEGAPRTTGARPGERPRVWRFPHPGGAASGRGDDPAG